MGSLNAIAAGPIYLDTNVLIYAVEDAAGMGLRLRPVFERIDRKEMAGVTSELTIAETLVRPLRDGNATAAREFQALLASNGPLTVDRVSRAVLMRAAELRAAHPAIKLPDAIHAATALIAGCTTFLTNDVRFEAVTGLPVLLLSKLP